MRDVEKQREAKRAWKRRNRDAVNASKRASERRRRKRFRDANPLAPRLTDEQLLARRRAIQTVNNAIRAGKLARGVCEVGVDCSGRIEGHHADYAKPLEVRWLCKHHHEAAHHG